MNNQNQQYQQYHTTPSGERLNYGPPVAAMSIAPPAHYGPPEGTATHKLWLSHALWLIQHPHGVAHPQINMSIEQAHAYAQRYAPNQYAQQYGIH